MRHIVCLLGLAVAACGSTPPAQPPPSKPTPSPEPATPEDAAAAAEAAKESPGDYPCGAVGAGKQLEVNFRDGYTTEDVAQWVIGWSCRTVVISGHAKSRTSKLGLAEVVRTEDLDALLERLLLRLDLAAVTEGKVTVFVDHDKRLGDGKPGILWQKPASKPAPVRDRFAKLLEDGIKQLDDGKVSLSRDVVDFALANPKLISRGARLVPSIKNGNPNGFKIYAIRPSSIYAKLGFMNGDTIHKVNGHDIDSPDKALEVYTLVREATELEFELTRRGKAATIDIRIVE